MLTQEQGGRLFRLVWNMAVRTAIEEPKATWVTPWEKMREWEQIIAKRVYTEVHETIVSHPEYYLALLRFEGGRLVREQWIRAVRLHVSHPKPAHLAPWEEMQEWEQEADCILFEHIRATALPYQLAGLSPDHAVWMAAEAVKNVHRIALAGPYMGDDQERAAQKGAALRIAELFAAPIAVSLEVLIEARTESGQVDAKYQFAYEEANRSLFKVRCDAANLNWVKRSEWLALLEGWYAQKRDSAFLDQFHPSEDATKLTTIVEQHQEPRESEETIDWIEGVRTKRHMPWLKRGLLVDVNGRRGLVRDGNASMNIQVGFLGTREVVNCHPTWETTYYDEKGILLAEYKKEENRHLIRITEEYRSSFTADQDGYRTFLQEYGVPDADIDRFRVWLYQPYPSCTAHLGNDGLGNYSSYAIALYIPLGGTDSVIKDLNYILLWCTRRFMQDVLPQFKFERRSEEAKADADAFADQHYPHRAFLQGAFDRAIPTSEWLRTWWTAEKAS